MNNPVESAAHVKLMSAKLESFDEATSTIWMSFVAPPEFITPRQSVQGGLIAGFLDEAMGWAYSHSTKGTQIPLMLDVTFSILKPVPQGPLLAKGSVVKAGRRVLFLEAELFLEDGETLLARSTSTAIPTEVPGKSG